jgi:hypothetical protein
MIYGHKLFFIDNVGFQRRIEKDFEIEMDQITQVKIYEF